MNPFAPAGPSHISCDVTTKHDGVVTELVDIDRSAWDTKTPEQRYSYLLERIAEVVSGRIYHYVVQAHNQGKFERCYHPMEQRFDMTIAEMEAEGMLAHEWEWRGYLNEDEMMRDHYGISEAEDEEFAFFEDGSEAMGWLDGDFWMFSPASPVKPGDRIYDKEGNFRFTYA